MAKSIAEVTKNYSEFSTKYQEYLQAQGKEEYAGDRYKWFRPENVTDKTDLKKLSEPLGTDEIEELGTRLYKEADTDTVNAGDYLLVMTQHDAIVSASRAFAERHKTRLRMFAHAAAACDRLGNENGVLKQGMDLMLTNVKARSSATTS